MENKLGPYVEQDIKEHQNYSLYIYKLVHASVIAWVRALTNFWKVENILVSVWLNSHSLPCSLVKKVLF